jgi:hypothetical protein
VRNEIASQRSSTYPHDTISHCKNGWFLYFQSAGLIAALHFSSKLFYNTAELKSWDKIALWCCRIKALSKKISNKMEETEQDTTQNCAA